MKKMTLLFIGVCALALASCDNQKDSDPNDEQANQSETDKTKEKINDALEDINEQDKILDIRSGKITFTYSGKYSGTETVWFDQYGNRVVMEQNIQTSPKMQENKRQVWTGQKEGSFICNYTDDFGNESDKTCQKMILRTKATELSIFAHGDESQLKYGYEPWGTQEILGKEATGWKSKSGNVTGWVWKGIDVEYNNSGIIKTMTAFEEIDKIPSEMMKMPDGFSMK